MASSSWQELDNYEREKWHRDLRDIDCWLYGCRQALENFCFWHIISRGFSSGVCWVLGAEHMTLCTRAISDMSSEMYNKIYGPYEHVLKVDLKPAPTANEAQGKGIGSIKYQLTVAVAKELGLLDQYNSLKEEHDKRQYYTYGCDGSNDLEAHVWINISPLVGKKLSTKNYLLVINNLMWPIDIRNLTWDCGLPLLPWTKSKWLIWPTFQAAEEVFKKVPASMSEINEVRFINIDKDIFPLIILALRHSAEYILNTICQERIEYFPSKKTERIMYWHGMALDCFHYAMAIFTKHSKMSSITSDELIHQWAVLLPSMTDTISSTSGKCSYMRQIGKVVLEAFQNHSLLELPFSPADESHKAIKTGAQFLAYHGLIAESITVDEVSDNKKKWISFVGDQGWHVSREWLMSHEEGTSGTTALILRGCSQQSPILSKLNHLLPKLCFLCVLDLSYTPLKSLPPAIGCLQILRLLSLRGCHDLKTLSSSSTTSATDSTKNTSSPLSTLYHLEILDLNGVPLSHITQDVANQKRNFIHLDMSHSEITTFPSKFFQYMSNLEELILVNCCKLVELPPSMVALSSLTTLEITGTQIKYFPQKIFEKLQKLQSLKLIDNNNLISLTGPVCRVHEIKLEGHPSLKSFSLIGVPHIQRLSLRGCRKLESVEFKNLFSLEELDLSGTAINELPAGIPNSTHLRRLLLLCVPSLLRFPWHMLERLPEVFYLDQCTEGNGNHSDQVTQLCVSDPRFFYSFGKSCVDLVRAGRIFQSFYIRVAPCSTKNMRLQHEEGIVDKKLRELLQNQSTYVDVRSSYAEEMATVSPITVPLRQTERHVEITGMQQPPEGLSSLLNVAKSISVTCDTSILDFSTWSRHLQDLEECELRWCHKMEQVFNYMDSDMENLRNVHICNLKSLVWFCTQACSFAFSSLEHLHLEYCPRMESMMTDSVTLPSLKTLDILFCYNLKEIFINVSRQDVLHQLPSLQRIRLQELPLLQHFNDRNHTVAAPMWKDLHVRGCWSLRRLPRLQDQPQVVKVNGESRWWSNLQWGSPSNYNNYDPKLPPKFASFDERAGVTSYLR